MRVLSISTDRKIFDRNSNVFLRTKDYASKTEEYHVVVFSLRSQNFRELVADNLYLYPTNSFSRFFYIFDAIRLGKKIILNRKLEKFDSIITAQDPFETGKVGYVLKKKFNLPLQIQVHTDFLDSHFQNSLLNRIRIRISKFTLPNADGIRVVSNVIADSLGRIFPKFKSRIDTLPIFVDINKIKESKSQFSLKEKFPQFKKIIFMATRLEKEKMIESALFAIKEVQNKVNSVGLVISGEGPQKESLVKLASDLEIEDKVTFIGWQDDLISCYKTSDVFLLTSKYEGYGMVLVEAAASGCPIVTTEVGLAKTALFKSGENSFVCPVDDVDCLSQSISKLLNDEKMRGLFKDRMRDSIKSMEVSYEYYLKKYLSLLSNLLEHESN